MKVCVVGCWHLGSVTAACVASFGHTVTGIDPEPSIVADLRRAVPPVSEPGLAELLEHEIGAGRLGFVGADAARAALGDADVVWVTYDTPVDDEDRPDTGWVVERVEDLLPDVAPGALVLISSQLPVGTTARLEQRAQAVAPDRRLRFAVSPENLRLGSAIEVFTDPERVVVGVRHEADRAVVSELLAPLGERIVWMSVESAEMTKHALNAFLATCVSFANELGVLCERVGADARDVAQALRSDPRVGPKAYVLPGAAFAGGTLGRDVATLADVGAAHGLPMHLVEGVRHANDAHRVWALTTLERELGALDGRVIAILGLTYKPGTSTLRRSDALGLAVALAERGAKVRAHDPRAETLPTGTHPGVQRVDTATDAVSGSEAVVVMTEWPEYRRVDPAVIGEGALVVDPNGFVADTFGGAAGIRYRAVGWRA